MFSGRPKCLARPNSYWAWCWLAATRRSMITTAFWSFGGRLSFPFQLSFGGALCRLTQMQDIRKSNQQVHMDKEPLSLLSGVPTLPVCGGYCLVLPFLALSTTAFFIAVNPNLLPLAVGLEWPYREVGPRTIAFTVSIPSPLLLVGCPSLEFNLVLLWTK